MHYFSKLLAAFSVGAILLVSCDDGESVFHGDGSDQAGIASRPISNVISQSCFEHESGADTTVYYDTTITSVDYNMRVYYNGSDYWIYAPSLSSADSTEVHFDSTGVVEVTRGYSNPTSTTSIGYYIRMEMRPYGYIFYKSVTSNGGYAGLKETCIWEGSLYY